MHQASEHAYDEFIPNKHLAAERLKRPCLFHPFSHSPSHCFPEALVLSYILLKGQREEFWTVCRDRGAGQRQFIA
jgi:hypothetical protein